MRKMFVLFLTLFTFLTNILLGQISQPTVEISPAVYSCPIVVVGAMAKARVTKIIMTSYSAFTMKGIVFSFDLSDTAKMKEAGVYVDDILLSSNPVITYLGGSSYSYYFIFQRSILANSSTQFSVNADIISGVRIQPILNSIWFEYPSGGNSWWDYYIPCIEFRVVDPFAIKLEFSRTPNLFTNTLYVYPGQYWYQRDGFYNNASDVNYLPNVIKGCRSSMGWGNYMSSFIFSYPSSYDSGFTNGQQWHDSTQQNLSWSWYSNSYDSGINSVNGFYVDGLNISGDFNKNYEVLLYGLGMPNSRTVNLNSHFNIQFMTGLRGDINGDGIVNIDDVNLAMRGCLADSELFNGKPLDFGKSLILSDWPGSIVDIWLLNIWVHNPNDPLVANLGIGALMSVNRPTVKNVPFTANVSNQAMIITTSGFAVNVSAILPNGKMWSSSVKVENGQAVVQLPYPGLKYRVNSVAIDGVSSINDHLTKPVKFELEQNYPNPFNPTTTINYSVPVSGLVSLSIFDVLGREVASLTDGEKLAGNYSVNFDASKLSSGTYIYRLKTSGYTATKKMILMK